jgi:hypothetical protein
MQPSVAESVVNDTVATTPWKILDLTARRRQRLTPMLIRQSVAGFETPTSKSYQS